MNKFSNVPEELKSLKRWVVWGASGSPADGVRRGVIKAPRSAKNPLAPASATDPGTWSDFDTAVKAVTEGLASGIGFAFNGDGLCGIDLDKVITDGELTKEAEEIVNLLASYTEISPSGRGLHIIVKKSDFPLAWNRRGFLEIYEDKRYFTVTGDVYKGFVSIEKRDEEVKMLLAEYPRNWKKAPETRDGDPYTPQRTSFAGDPGARQ
jgi:putative DNA primase/helicase